MEKRNPIPTADAKERIKGFGEVALGYDEETAVKEAERCLQCKNAPCKKGCPVGVSIPEFISCIKNRDFAASVKVMKGDNNLPSVCGRVCPQEEQCEKYCVRKAKLGGSVGIGYLERFIGDYALKAKSEIKPAAKNGRKAAVIGSGPSGLTAAADLALAGFEVTIYESLHKAGGVLIYGIPEFRLPKDIVEREIETLLDLGVKIELNAVIGKTITVDELMKENDAVYIATGAGLPSFLGVKGENLNGVYSANEYLTRVNLMKAYREDSDTPLIRGKNVVVVGAGNVAMDSARTALRLGGKVTLVYRRTREEMPARAEEIEHALEEGVEFRLLTNPIEILGENGRVTGIRCIKMELGEPDASGRRRPIAVPGSEHEIACDQVIVALGTTPNPLLKNSFKRLNTTDKGTILINENGETNVENLFAGGDAVTGAATVILAMGAGKTAARTIIERFKNNN